MMDAAAPVLRAVGALREARHGDDVVLADPAVAKSLLDVIPAEFATFTDLDIRGQRVAAAVELVDQDYPEEPFGQFWDHFWGSLTCSYTEQIPRLRTEVMSTGDFYSDRQWHSTGMYAEVLHPAGVEKELLIPLQAPPGIARRLVFFRGPRGAFTDDERDAAVLLQPHICQALRSQARLSAARRLTARQLQLLELVVAGHDNSTVARRLGLSPGTVRKHLENTYARLGVTSRTAAAAQAFPDITWL
jgi:DNA-binding CsgD family transcriptional regulator